MSCAHQQTRSRRAGTPVWENLWHHRLSPSLSLSLSPACLSTQQHPALSPSAHPQPADGRKGLAARDSSDCEEEGWDSAQRMGQDCTDARHPPLSIGALVHCRPASAAPHARAPSSPHSASSLAIAPSLTRIPNETNSTIEGECLNVYSGDAQNGCGMLVCSLHRLAATHPIAHSSSLLPMPSRLPLQMEMHLSTHCSSIHPCVMRVLSVCCTSLLSAGAQPSFLPQDTPLSTQPAPLHTHTHTHTHHADSTPLCHAATPLSPSSTRKAVLHNASAARRHPLEQHLPCLPEAHCTDLHSFHHPTRPHGHPLSNTNPPVITRVARSSSSSLRPCHCSYSFLSLLPPASASG